MKRTKFFNLLIVALALTCVVSTGCKKKPTPITPLPNATGKTGGMTDPSQAGMIEGGKGVETGGGAISDTRSHVGWGENAEVFKSETIHFDYDSAKIRKGEVSKIETVAAYLKAHSEDAVRVEGNCDERGTEEYNRALGERRALAAREELVKLGIAADRVDTISYGKDRPVDTANNEAAFKKNRRDDFVLLSPPK